MDKNTQRELKAQAHHLKPVIIIGNNGVTEPVLAEIDKALYDHELIKIRLNASDAEERQQMIEKICASQKADLIGKVGHVAIFYRESDKFED